MRTKTVKIDADTIRRANEAISLGRKPVAAVRSVPGMTRELANRLKAPFSTEDIQRAAKLAMRRHASRGG